MKCSAGDAVIEIAEECGGKEIEKNLALLGKPRKRDSYLLFPFVVEV